MTTVRHVTTDELADMKTEVAALKIIVYALIETLNSKVHRDIKDFDEQGPRQGVAFVTKELFERVKTWKFDIDTGSVPTDRALRMRIDDNLRKL